jgi:hypothetical protein
VSLILGLLAPSVAANCTAGRRRRKNRKALIMKLVRVDSGTLGAGSILRRLSTLAVAQWRDQHPETTVVYRDLVSDPVDHLTGELLAAKKADPTMTAFPPVRPTGPFAVWRRKSLAELESGIIQLLAA